MRLFHTEAAGELWHGDGQMAVLDQKVGVSGNVVIVDPPYGTAKYATDVALPDEFFARIIKSSTCAAIFGWPEDLVALCVRIQQVPNEWVTWSPPNKWLPRAQSLRQAECIAIFGEAPGFNRVRRDRSEACKRMIEKAGDRVSTGPIDSAQDGDVWTMNAPGCGFNHAQRKHPNEKPLELMTRLVLLCSNEGDTIVDPTMGSGTTCEAARSLGRRFIGVELVEEHCATAVERLRQQDMFAIGGTS